MNQISQAGLEVAANDGLEVSGSDGMQTHDKHIQEGNGQALSHRGFASRRNRYLPCVLGQLPFALLIGVVAFIAGGALGGGLGAKLSK